MKEINNGIVFSNDIERILKGYNALDFKIDGNLPSSNLITYLRRDFLLETQKIFNNQVTIITEEDMLTKMNSVIKDCLGYYPHCYFR